MSEITSLTFYSQAEFYKFLTGGWDGRGRPAYLQFLNGTYTTSDPAEIDLLMGRFAVAPWEVWPDPDAGVHLCPICYKPCKTELALNGHMRSHKEVRDAGTGSESADQEG